MIYTPGFSSPTLAELARCLTFPFYPSVPICFLLTIPEFSAYSICYAPVAQLDRAPPEIIQIMYAVATKYEDERDTKNAMDLFTLIYELTGSDEIKNKIKLLKNITIYNIFYFFLFFGIKPFRQKLSFFSLYAIFGIRDPGYQHLCRTLFSDDKRIFMVQLQNILG